MAEKRGLEIEVQAHTVQAHTVQAQTFGDGLREGWEIVKERVRRPEDLRSWWLRPARLQVAFGFEPFFCRVAV